MPPALNEKPFVETLPAAAGASVILDGRYLPPPEDKDGKLWVRTSALIQANASELYAMWRDVESAPAWQEQITKVVATGERTSHWIMQSGEKTIEWDSEVSGRRAGQADRVALDRRRIG